MNDYVVAALIVLNAWFGVKYLLLPGVRLRKWIKKNKLDPKGDSELETAKKKKNLNNMQEAFQVESGGVKAIAYSMIVAFFSMMWLLFLWGSMQAFGGVEGFCSNLLDKF